LLQFLVEGLEGLLVVEAIEDGGHGDIEVDVLVTVGVFMRVLSGGGDDALAGVEKVEFGPGLLLFLEGHVLICPDIKLFGLFQRKARVQILLPSLLFD
jgi:hypothetical protein